MQTELANPSRLRIVFSDAVVSCSLAADATFGEIAETLVELSNQRYGDPVAIEVTLRSREGYPIRRLSRRPGPGSPR